MKSRARLTVPLMLATLMAGLVACGGGGGGSGGATAVVTPQEVDGSGQMLSYAADIAPILQARCVGCHNSGDNPLAPFSLDGEAQANSFRSAINFVMQGNTMPPADAPQPTASERAKLLAWSTGQPYKGTLEILRIPLVAASAWDITSQNRERFPDHRPASVDCPQDKGWIVEGDALEIRTEFCNYAALTQQALLDLAPGTELELVLSHSTLNFNAPANAHIALSIGDHTVWEKHIPIPSEGALYKETVTLPVAVGSGDAIQLHLHNHGDNAWSFHSLDALVPSDQEITLCPTFDSTFEAIQATVFEQAGCANSLCHSGAATNAGGLDLTPEHAWENLVDVRATGSSLLLVNPKQPSLSYLYQKLSAKVFPGSYDISGSPMPSAGTAITAGQLDAIRLWIEAGAPKTGSVGDALGRGEDEIERLLGVCLPEAEALNTVPLPAPTPDKGIQLTMPPHPVPAESEREMCFAVYEDFREQIPEEYLTPDRNYFYARSGEIREDFFTHHNVLYKSPAGVDLIHDPSFGAWTCVGGEHEGQGCEPTDRQSCGAGQCRSAIRNSVACRGYGPSLPDNGLIVGLETGIERDGFYAEFPAHGIFYWNSHAFNLANEDGVHHVWRNVYFADDRRFKSQDMSVTGYVYLGAGTPAFEKKTVCRDYVFDQGDGLLELNSHTHKRGERFFMTIGDEQIYETFDYEEPLRRVFNPPRVFNSADPAERTLTWCATYNNGVNPDGSPNTELVTRLSRRPDNAGPCKPTACVAGRVGASCNGADDDAACDSAPGAGDGWCDACPITAGVSSDDEMFILLGNKLPNHDAQVNGQ
jgi:hypothetical protein